MALSFKFFMACFIFCLSAHPQKIDYARQLVNTLASDEFKGRGYVDEADRLAADYIREEFEKLGLIPFKKNYFQHFNTPVNTFPSSMKLFLNGKKLLPGEDFLVGEGSPAIKGEYATLVLRIEDMFDQETLFEKLFAAKGKFIIVQAYEPNDYSEEQQQKIREVISFLKYSADNPAAATIFLSKDKLSWSTSTQLFPKAFFIVKSDSNQSEIERVSVDVESEFIKNYKTQNVLGYIDGVNNDSMIVLTAHYDHLGMMGEEAIFNGANDNASGVAMLLSLADHFSKSKNPPKYRIVFIAFAAEELGLLGSKHFVENPLFELSKIKFLLNFDLAGTGDEGIQVVNATIHKDQFASLVQLNDEHNLLAKVKSRGEACISDHCLFHRKDVPCFYIYTLGGSKAYHDIHDRAEKLTLIEFDDYFKLMSLFIEKL